MKVFASTKGEAISLKKLGQRVSFAIWSAVLAVAIGCSHVTRYQATGLQSKGFWEDQARRGEELKWVSGKLRFSYSGKDHAVSGKGRVLQQLPTQVRLEIRDPLGRVAFVAALEGKKFTAFYPSQKKALLGNDGGEDYFRSHLGFQTSFDDLQRIVVGILPTRAGKGPLAGWEWDEIRGAYWGELKSGDTRWRVWVDGKSAAIRELWIESPRETAKIAYSDFEPCCPSLSYFVQISLERAKTKVEWEWEEIEKLEKPRSAESFQIHLPADAKRLGIQGNVSTEFQ